MHSGGRGAFERGALAVAAAQLGEVAQLGGGVNNIVLLPDGLICLIGSITNPWLGKQICRKAPRRPAKKGNSTNAHAS